MKDVTPDPFEYIFIDVTDPIFGAQLGKATLRVHTRARCAGERCCIHNPSDHAAKSWPQNWRADRGIMERLCRHGVGHPDPDDLIVKARPDAAQHGCDGCCRFSEDGMELVWESLEQMARGEGVVISRPQRKTTPPSPGELQ